MLKILAIVLSMFVSDTPEVIVKDHCDYVVINHVYNLNEETGKATLRMTQYIWWEWKNSLLLPKKDQLGNETGDWYRGSGFVIRDFRVTLSSSSRPNEVLKIVVSKTKSGYVCIFFDKQNNLLREVHSKWRSETHTFNDVEIDNRNILNMEFRRKLYNP